MLLKFVYSSVTLCYSSYEYKSADLTLLSPNLKQKEIRLLVDVSTPNLLSNINIAKGALIKYRSTRSLFDWAMKPFSLRRMGHHIV